MRKKRDLKRRKCWQRWSWYVTANFLISENRSNLLNRQIISGLQDEIKVLKTEMSHCNQNHSNPNLLLPSNITPFMRSVNSSSNVSNMASQHHSLYSTQSNNSSTPSFAASFPSSFYSNINNLNNITLNNSNSNELFAQESLLFSQFADLARYNGDTDSNNRNSELSNEQLLLKALQPPPRKEALPFVPSNVSQHTDYANDASNRNSQTVGQGNLRDSALDFNNVAESTGTESSSSEKQHHHSSNGSSGANSDSARCNGLSKKRAAASWAHKSFDSSSVSDITSQAGSGSSSSSKNSGKEEVGEGGMRARSDSSARSTNSGCTHSECSRSPPASPKGENSSDMMKANEKANLIGIDNPNRGGSYTANNQASMASLEYKKYAQHSDNQFKAVSINNHLQQLV